MEKSKENCIFFNNALAISVLLLYNMLNKQEHYIKPMLSNCKKRGAKK